MWIIWPLISYLNKADAAVRTDFIRRRVLLPLLLRLLVVLASLLDDNSDESVEVVLWKDGKDGKDGKDALMLVLLAATTSRARPRISKVGKLLTNLRSKMKVWGKQKWSKHQTPMLIIQIVNLERKKGHFQFEKND
jgi:hypothetical protein